MTIDTVAPHLSISQSTPLSHLEESILKEVAAIESWFRSQWLVSSPPITTSVDLRHEGFKLAPVDTNLFPAGFNNLNPRFLPLCIQAMQATMTDFLPNCKKILILPENHTRNHFYFESLGVLRYILLQAGFMVRIGSLDPNCLQPIEVVTEKSGTFLMEPVVRRGSLIALPDFHPCMILLNNDLSSGIPPLLEGVENRICPSIQLGWHTRLKSTHFQCYQEVVKEFASVIHLDPWLITPQFAAVEGVDFMAQEGIDQLAAKAESLLMAIQDKYSSYQIKAKPFLAVKADNGTYGMSVMMIQDAEELRQLNRKQRTRMATSKGSQKVDKLILQEGVYTYEVMPNGAVAEPVIYLVGRFVVGGFYRVHQDRGVNENLNAPGMHFEHLPFDEPCNMPKENLRPMECPNRYYVYGVIARLAALAAAKERQLLGIPS